MSREEKIKKYFKSIVELVDGLSIPRLKLKNIRDVATTALSEMEIET